MPVGSDGFRLPTVIQGVNKNKIECLPGEQDDFCKTFVINDEDHTLGNALKHIIVHYPAVVFCGYTVPHPMERKIHLRIQSVKTPATDILRQGIKDLKKQNEEVLKMIKIEVENFKES
ncbi:UNVERIFIED_CONTAM: hypothetical protein GTU68_005969 [Idotea baltica]|nr:hypothetical protein [Idotea baltica]